MRKSIGQTTWFLHNLVVRGEKKDLKGKPIERELRDLTVDYNAWTLFVSLFKTNCKKKL